ncbi:sulfatase [Deltaproteobacteria bacterium]|nr:sulfatase [Deltaproteobacteria bacterium]
MVALVLLFACSTPAESPPAAKPARVKSEEGSDLQVDWPAVPADLARGDRDMMASALTKAGLAAASRPIPQKKGTKAPNILVIVLDTVRADHLGMYGYTEGTTPKLDAWATGARVWENAWTDAPWTLPAHASMFTGKSQREHGARSVGRDDPRKGAPLGEGNVTIAERLQAVGYRTVAVAANPAFLHPSYGLGQGFDVWMNEGLGADPRGVPYLAADRVVPLAEAALAQEDEHPLFLFVNFIDAHRPYKARKGFVKSPELLRKASLPGEKGYAKMVRKLMAGGPLDLDLRDSWVQGYDAELRWLDQNVSQLLGNSRVPSTVFLLSDHGEYLGEHSLVEHAKDVYEPVLHVPFMAKGPDFLPGRDTAPVQGHDLAWMVLQTAGLDSADLERTGSLQVADLYYTLKKDLMAPYGKRFDRIRRAFRVGSKKYINGSDGTREAYDLEADPGERGPLVEVPAELLAAETVWLAAHPEVPVVPESEGGALGPDEEALKALGYAE